jgi:hypothetical protein
MPAIVPTPSLLLPLEDEFEPEQVRDGDQAIEGQPGRVALQGGEAALADAELLGQPLLGELASLAPSS